MPNPSTDSTNSRQASSGLCSWRIFHTITDDPDREPDTDEQEEKKVRAHFERVRDLEHTVDATLDLTSEKAVEKWFRSRKSARTMQFRRAVRTDLDPVTFERLLSDEERIAQETALKLMIEAAKKAALTKKSARKSARKTNERQDARTPAPAEDQI